MAEPRTLRPMSQRRLLFAVPRNIWPPEACSRWPDLRPPVVRPPRSHEGAPPLGGRGGPRPDRGERRSRCAIPAALRRPLRGPLKAVRAKAADAAQMAADWVSQQVSRKVTVACDPLMCAALEARGVPTAGLLVLRTDAPSPLGAGVVVVTPAIRSQFGSRLDSQYAPSVIAGFGSGPSQVKVQVVAPDGVATYRAELRKDQAGRKAAGTQLLANKQIGVTAQARTQLTAGTVDSRLLILLPALAAAHPIQVRAFGNSGPGAGSDIPLCTADLSGSDMPPA